MVSASPWWHPSVHADRRPFLLARGRMVKALRGYFESHDFLEVETASLQVSPGDVRRPVYLHTSPEFTCKKLLAAGEGRIVAFARVYRNRERSALHHPEFTLLEWYRAHEGYEMLMNDCAEILALAADVAERRVLSWRGQDADPFAAPERLTVAEAFERYAGFNLMATIGAAGDTDRDGLAARACHAGVRVSPVDTWSDVFSRILSE